MPKHLNKYTQEEFNKEVEDAKKIWDTEIEDCRKDPNFELESINCPMHPSVFYELSSVDGFNKKNGFTYREYTNLWRERSNT